MLGALRIENSVIFLYVAIDNWKVLKKAKANGKVIASAL